MAYGTPADPVPTTVITVAYAVTNLLDPIRALRANTGAADPPALNRVAVSTGVGGPTSWQQVPADAILDGAVTDAKLASAKVARTAPGFATFSAAMAQLSSLCYLNVPADAPSVVNGDWQLLQVTVPHAPTYGWQLTSALNVNELYTRVVTAGTGGPWRRLWHSGNDGSGSGLDAGLFEGRTFAQATTEIAATVPGATVEVPTGVIAMWRTSMTPPTGWVVEDQLYNLLPGGVNATQNGTFGALNSTAGAVSHNHTLNNHAHNMNNHTHGSGGLGITGTATGTESASGQSGGTGTNRADSPHTHDSGDFDVSGSTDAPSNNGTSSNNDNTSTPLSTLPPYRAVLFIKKS